MIGKAVKENAMKQFKNYYQQKKNTGVNFTFVKLHITERKLREVAAGKGATITWKEALCP